MIFLLLAVLFAASSFGSEEPRACLNDGVCYTGSWRGGGAGLSTNSIFFCFLFTFKDRCAKVRFQQTHNQGLHQLILTVSWDLCAKASTAQLTGSLFLSSVRSNAVEGPWRPPCQALQGSETETGGLLVGMEEKRISPTRVNWIALQANQWFFTKMKRGKNRAFARPCGRPLGQRSRPPYPTSGFGCQCWLIWIPKGRNL